jgi:hypothetical protein
MPLQTNLHAIEQGTANNVWQEHIYNDFPVAHVIPAKAGIQHRLLGSRLRGNDEFLESYLHGSCFELVLLEDGNSSSRAVQRYGGPLPGISKLRQFGSIEPQTRFVNCQTRSGQHSHPMRNRASSRSEPEGMSVRDDLDLLVLIHLFETL